MASKKAGRAASLAALAGLAYMANKKGMFGGKGEGKGDTSTAADREDAEMGAAMKANAASKSKSDDITVAGEGGFDAPADMSRMGRTGTPATATRMPQATKAPATSTPSGAYRGMRSDMKDIGGGRSSGRGGPEAGEEAAYRSARAAASPAVSIGGSGGGRGPAFGEEQRARIDKAFEAPSESDIQKGLEMGVGGPSLRVLNAAAKGLANRGLKSKLPQLDRPGTVSGEKFVMRDYKDPNVAASIPQKALPAPRKGDITDVTPKNTNPRSLTGEAREDAKADRFRRGLEDLADNSMKRGGKVKKMASGGMTSSASSASRRGDGIASKGKTRCKMY